VEQTKPERKLEASASGLVCILSYHVNSFVYNRMAKTGGNPQNFNNPVKSSLAPLTFRLEDKQIDAWVRSLPNKSEWLRNAIAAQYERDMAAKGGSDSDSESDT
jgi:hypothetical protein